jgi:hypothetical protein
VTHWQLVTGDWSLFRTLPILRFCHEWGQNKRWGAVRHVIVTGILIRVFLVLTNILDVSKNTPKMKNIFEHVENVENLFFRQKQIFGGGVQNVFWRVWAYSGPIPTHN